MASDAERVNRELEKRFSDFSDTALSGLAEAQKYSLLSGGKRIRPILTLAFSRLFGGSDEAAMPYALAVEMIHTASLIHDDLPAIDNDDLRRGRPTNHKVFGEAAAILAGDALFMDAFGLVASNGAVSAECTVHAVRSLSLATGTLGLVGGEYTDVTGEGKRLSLPELKKMHSMKTGALIRTAAELGALSAGVLPEDGRMRSAVKYAESIGLAFQIVDDVLDVTGNTAELGKSVGSDAAASKNTYLNFYTPSEALKYARELTDEAVLAISEYEGNEFLTDLALYLAQRRN